MRYDICPLCKHKMEFFPNDQRGCRNSFCSSGFTDWGENDYYFVRAYEKGEMPLTTDFIIETFPNKGLTRISRGYDFNKNHLFNINSIYNLSLPEELNQLLKIVDRAHKNLSLK